MALTLCYFAELGKSAFQHITASVRIELIDQNSASITHRIVKFACVITKCTHSRVGKSRISVLRTCNLPFKFRFTVAFLF